MTWPPRRRGRRRGRRARRRRSGCRGRRRRHRARSVRPAGRQARHRRRSATSVWSRAPTRSWRGSPGRSSSAGSSVSRDWSRRARTARSSGPTRVSSPFLRDAPFGIPGDVGDVLRWPGVSRGREAPGAAGSVQANGRTEPRRRSARCLRRRLGDEATDLAVAPLLAGLHAGDVDRLSAHATFPELLAWESSQGSLIRGSQAAMRSARRGTPTPMFLRPKGGVGRLTDALAASLGRPGRDRRAGRLARRRGARAATSAATRAGGAGVRGGSPGRLRRATAAEICAPSRTSRPASCSSSIGEGTQAPSRTGPASSSRGARHR